ncbi:MAG: septal ring lytic transglycosylase RlpA family protein [Bacteroidetes bacterium]|nr:septal ring lytic transglycosylase RlpA family protein [Bacteroidota bacterium]
MNIMKIFVVVLFSLVGIFFTNTISFSQHIPTVSIKHSEAFWAYAKLMHDEAMLKEKLPLTIIDRNEAPISWSGKASYYHPKFDGRKTSNGEVFSNDKFTCANNFLKLGTVIRVTNMYNGKSVIVKVNDRMHAKNHRLVDLSQAAAKKLGLIQQGIGVVCIEIVDAALSTIALR